MAIMSKTRTWVLFLFIMYTLLLSTSFNLLKNILNCGDGGLYTAMLLWGVFGMVSIAAALTVVVPATVVVWIAVVVMMSVFGKKRKDVVVEGRKMTREIVVFVFKVLIREGNYVAAVFTVFGYFLLVIRNYYHYNYIVDD
ncbi:hypothetical protein ACFE04_031362 [Oxalis oulophora]